MKAPMNTEAQVVSPAYVMEMRCTHAVEFSDVKMFLRTYVHPEMIAEQPGSVRKEQTLARFTTFPTISLRIPYVNV